MSPARVARRSRQSPRSTRSPPSGSAGVLRSAISSATPQSSRISIDALVEHVRLRQVGGAGARADQEVIDALTREKHGGGEPGSSAADDQDRDFLVHVLLPPHIRATIGMHTTELCFVMSTTILRYDATRWRTRTAVTPNSRGTRSRELVLDAAERLMAQKGYEAATVSALVDEAGVPASSIYHYFGSKEGVLLAVMERGAERFFERCRSPPSPGISERASGGPRRDRRGGATGQSPLPSDPDRDGDPAGQCVRRRGPPSREPRPGPGSGATSRPDADRLRRRSRWCGRGPARALRSCLLDGAFVAQQASPRVRLGDLRRASACGPDRGAGGPRLIDLLENLNYADVAVPLRAPGRRRRRTGRSVLSTMPGRS